MKYCCLLISLLAFSAAANAQTPISDSIYEQVDFPADFPGGANGWTMYLMKNLTYPSAAITTHVTGSVILQFVIDKKGKVSKVKALSGPDILQEEAIRLIKDSPRWTPAIKNGEKVKSYKKQTIGFRLEGSLYNN